jgi:hypothetical protein
VRPGRAAAREAADRGRVAPRALINRCSQPPKGDCVKRRPRGIVRALDAPDAAGRERQADRRQRCRWSEPCGGLAPSAFTRFGDGATARRLLQCHVRGREEATVAAAVEDRGPSSSFCRRNAVRPGANRGERLPGRPVLHARLLPR